MTESSRPFTGRTSDGAPGDAGAYSAEQWATTWRTLIGTGAEKANRGVIRGVLEELEVTPNSPADTTVILQTGSAMVQGRWYLNDADLSIPIASNASGSTRIDIIGLECDYAAQTVRAVVIQGTPGAGLPALTQNAEVLWQIPLVYLTLSSGFTTIPASAITDFRSYANIPDAVGIPVLNASGATLEMGTLVYIFAGGNPVQIAASATEGQRSIIGVIESRLLNGATGRAIVSGVFPVLCDELVAAGAVLEASTTAGQAQAMLMGGNFARVLQVNTGAGTRCLAYINVLPDPATIVTGTYTGNGAATQAITGLGFKPRKVVVYRQATTNTGAIFSKNDRDTTTNAITYIARNAGALDTTYAYYSNDAIRSLDNDGFTVGDTSDNTTNQTNANGVTYVYEAYR